MVGLHQGIGTFTPGGVFRMAAIAEFERDLGQTGGA
jgi:hypothetical protein